MCVGITYSTFWFTNALIGILAFCESIDLNCFDVDSKKKYATIFGNHLESIEGFLSFMTLGGCAYPASKDRNMVIVS